MDFNETVEPRYRASGLYRRLLEYAVSPPFAEQAAANVRRVMAMGDRDHHGGLCGRHQHDRVVGMAVEQLVFDHPPTGLRLIDRYAEWSADLTGADRRLLDGWRTSDVLSPFEIRRREGAGVRAHCLLDDRDYLVHVDPRTPLRREDLRTGRYLLGHALPVGDAWMLAGPVEVHAPDRRTEMFGLAAEFARCAPAIPYRNPAILAEAQAALRVQHELFLDTFGEQGAARSGRALLEDLGDFFDDAGLWDRWWPSLLLERDLCELRDADDGRISYPVHDPVHGLRVLGERYGRVASLHRTSGPVRDGLALALRAVVDDATIPSFALRDLGDLYPARAGKLYAAALQRPGFAWERDGAAWLAERAEHEPAHPGLVWMPGGARPAGTGRPDRRLAIGKPLVTSHPHVTPPPGITTPS